MLRGSTLGVMSGFTWFGTQPNKFVMVELVRMTVSKMIGSYKQKFYLYNFAGGGKRRKIYALIIACKIDLRKKLFSTTHQHTYTSILLFFIHYQKNSKVKPLNMHTFWENAKFARWGEYKNSLEALQCVALFLIIPGTKSTL